MMRAPSLTLRLMVHLLLVQMLAIIVASLVVIVMSVTGLAGSIGWKLTDYSYYRIRDLVSDSLIKASDGSLYLEPNAQLRREIERTPTLKFAVFESVSKGALPGSSTELSVALSSNNRLETRSMDFFIAGVSRSSAHGSIFQWNTPYGPLFIAASGYVFRWTDLFYVLRDDLNTVSSYFFAAFAASAIVSWLVVRRALAPLRRAAEAANDIDMGRLGQGIPTEGAPVEAKPLIDAINRALARLDASAARMRRYVANAAHELRTPVAILRARLDNPEEPSFKTDLKRDARRLQAIIDQLLIVARLNEGQMGLDQETDLVSLIKTIIGDYAPLAVKAERTIEFEADEQSSYTRCNPQAIKCVIVNLVDNALRAEPKGGTVLIRCRRNGVVEVIDHGSGIMLEDREKIFEPFWRKCEATPGAGLGLSITKEILDAHGGEIRIEETPGGGATFILLFKPPQEENPAANPCPSQDISACSHRS